MTLKLLIGATPGTSQVVDAATNAPLDGVIACQLSGGDNGFAPLVHLTLAGVEIVRQAAQGTNVTQVESPFMTRGD